MKDLNEKHINVGDKIRFSIFTTLMNERGDVPRDYIFEGVVQEDWTVKITNFPYIPLRLKAIIDYNSYDDDHYLYNNIVKCLEVIC